MRLLVEREGFETTWFKRHGGLVKSRKLLIELVRRSGEKRILRALLKAARSALSRFSGPTTSAKQRDFGGPSAQAIAVA
jgi:hypothetical protein